MHKNEIITMIREGNRKKLEEVYKDNRTSFIQWICSTQRVPMDDAADIYQQTIVVFYENIVSGKLIELKSNVRTYLFAIGKNKVSEYRRYQAKTSGFEDYQTPQNEDVLIEKQDNEKMIELSKKCLEIMGDPCRTILELYYYHKRNMQEIADEMGYKNEIICILMMLFKHISML